MPLRHSFHFQIEYWFSACATGICNTTELSNGHEQLIRAQEVPALKNEDDKLFGSHNESPKTLPERPTPDTGGQVFGVF